MHEITEIIDAPASRDSKITGAAITVPLERDSGDEENLHQNVDEGEENPTAHCVLAAVPKGRGGSGGRRGGRALCQREPGNRGGAGLSPRGLRQLPPGRRAYSGPQPKDAIFASIIPIPAFA